MMDLLLDALFDSAEMVPLLLVMYVLVEWFERRLGETIDQELQKTTKLGPFVGAVFGCIPQCGFSALASALYARRLITTGTLLSVYLATSDEAIPVILAQPDKGSIVVTLLITKLIIGVVSGYAVDLAFRRRVRQPPRERRPTVHGPGKHLCCVHQPTGRLGKWRWLMHPVIHTAKIFVFIVAVTFGINGLISLVGEAAFGKLLLRQTVFQPFLATLIGLIPNCAASVGIAQVFLMGGLSYGSTVASLCSSAGLGILVLYRENDDIRDTVRVLLLLAAISVTVGLAIQSVYG